MVVCSVISDLLRHFPGEPIAHLDCFDGDDVDAKKDQNCSKFQLGILEFSLACTLHAGLGNQSVMAKAVVSIGRKSIAVAVVRRKDGWH
jgi:hypothetical protein